MGLLPLRPLALLRGRLRHLQPGFASQAFNRLDEIEVLGPHDIADRIAMRAAAEAMKKTLVLDDVEGRGLLVVEGAKAGMFAALAAEAHPPADQIGQRDPRTQLVEKSGRKGHVFYCGPRVLIPAAALRWRRR